MAQIVLSGQKRADMQHFAYERFAEGKEIYQEYWADAESPVLYCPLKLRNSVQHKTRT